VHTGTRQERSCEQSSPTSCCCHRPWPPCSYILSIVHTQEPGRSAAAYSSPQHPASVPGPGRNVLIFSLLCTHRNPAGAQLRTVLPNILQLSQALAAMFLYSLYCAHRNPAGAQLRTVLPNILLLSQTLAAMFGPDQKARVHPGFAKAFDLLEVDKNNILGLPGSRSGQKSPTTFPLTGIRYHWVLLALHLLQARSLFSCCAEFPDVALDLACLVRIRFNWCKFFRRNRLN
jgi:hypothetical protein